jgi:hypothetical protein
MTAPMVRRQVMNPPPLTEADLKPGRYADHALLERLFAWTAWLLLGGCVGLAALSRFRHHPLAWGLSARVQDLIRPSDWLWMVAGGVVFPLVWYGIFTRLTPLSAHEWNARMSVFIMPGGQFGCLLLAGSSLYFYSQERRWIQQDRIFGPSPFQYESAVAQVLRAELLEIIGEPADAR